MGRASDVLGGLLAGALPASVKRQIAAAQYEIEAAMLDAEAGLTANVARSSIVR